MGRARPTVSGATGPRAAAAARWSQPFDVESAPLQHISIERRVDLSGTLVSPDQARVSSEVAGIIRDVRVQLGTEVRVGDVLVRLEPRELALALERAESALRQVEAQLGIDRTQDKQPPPDDQIASVRQAMANRDDARAAFERAQQLNGRGLLPRSTATPPRRASRSPRRTIRPRSTTSAASRRACRIGGRPTSWRRRS